MNIFTCASVSLFDINDHKKRKISRRKISLCLKKICKDIVIENGRMSFILCGDRAVSSFVFKVDNDDNDHKRKNEMEKENEKEVDMHNSTHTGAGREIKSM